MAKRGPIQKLIQLILDPNAAKKAERDAKQTLSGIDKAIDGLRGTIAKVGAALVGFLGLRALANTVKGWVEEGVKAERVWSRVGGTVDQLGGNWKRQEKDVRAMADAWQEATRFGGEEFAQTFQLLAVRSGDLTASMANMGLVANVAAQFFGGELAPAAELVAKVMNGNTTQLQKMGIHVKSAQQGLEVLAKRSFGAAERDAKTFGGQLSQLNNLWGDFRKELGLALIDGASGTPVMKELRDTLKDMVSWVKSNATEIGTFARSAIGFIRDVGREIQAGLRALGLARMTQGAQTLETIPTTGSTADQEKSLEAQLASLRRQRSQAQRDVNTAQGELEKAEGRSFFTRGEFVSLFAKTVSEARGDLKLTQEQLDEIDQSIQRVVHGLRIVRGQVKPDPVLGGSGRATGNAPDDRAENIAKARKDFQESMQAATTQAQLLGGRFDVTAAKTKALTEYMEKLASFGVEPTNAEMQDLARQLAELPQQFEAVLPSQDRIAARLELIRRKSEALGDAFDPLRAEMDLWAEELETAFANGATVADVSVQGLLLRLKQLNDQVAQRDNLSRMNTELDIASVSFDGMGRPIDAATLSLDRMQLAAENLTAKLRTLKRESSDYGKTLEELARVQAAIASLQRQIALIEEIGSQFGSFLGAALQSGIAPAAKLKARENLLLAAEDTVRALVAGFLGLGGLLVGKYAAAAKMHLGIAAGWSALAGGASALGIGGGGGGGSAGTSAVQASASAASRAEPSTEVHIHLDGPGFHALNPKVQRVVFGAMQEARNRFGETAKIILHRDGR